MALILRFTFIVFFTAFAGIVSFTQSIDQVLRNSDNCLKMEVSVLNALPKYYEKGMYDSIYLLVAYARHYCPNNGVYNLLHNLCLIQYGRPIDSTFERSDILVIAQDVKKMKLYRRSMDKLNSGEWTNVRLKQVSDYYKQKYPYNEWALMGMIQKWASALLPDQKAGSMEELLCNLLSGQLGGMMRWVYREPYKASPITKGYARYHYEQVLHRTVYQEFSTGLSVPVNQYLYQLMGPRLTVSYALGYRKGAHRFDGSFGTRLGNYTKEPFMVNRTDTSFFSTKAYNFQTGLQYARKISGLHSRWEWNALGGVLMDFWAHVPSVDTRDDEDNLIPELVAVENKVKPYRAFGMFPQIGIEAKYFSRAGSAVGLSLKYQYMNYFGNNTQVTGSMFLVSMHWCNFTKFR